MKPQKTYPKWLLREYTRLVFRHGYTKGLKGSLGDNPYKVTDTCFEERQDVLLERLKDMYGNPEGRRQNNGTRRRIVDWFTKSR